MINIKEKALLRFLIKERIEVLENRLLLPFKFETDFSETQKTEISELKILLDKITKL